MSTGGERVAAAEQADLDVAAARAQGGEPAARLAGLP